MTETKKKQSNNCMKDVDSTTKYSNKLLSMAKQNILNDFRIAIDLYNEGVMTHVSRLQSLSIRSIHKFRFKLTKQIFYEIISDYTSGENYKEVQELLLGFLQKIEDEDGDFEVLDKSIVNQPITQFGQEIENKNGVEIKRKCLTIESECFLKLILSIFLIDKRNFDSAEIFLKDLLEKINSQNSRALDMICSRAYFYYSYIFLKKNKLKNIRQYLHNEYRRSCLQHDDFSQAVLINCILQNYLHYNLISIADKFRLNSTFPELHGGIYQHTRYLYYIGKINAIQLQYSEAFNNLSQAIRKAPQNSAIGFRQQVSKLYVIVQLLLGEIPERSIFTQHEIKNSIRPYFFLTQAVRSGNITSFTSIMAKYKDRFIKDTTYLLVLRLRHNVIKTGLRNISLSYSRISLKDIAFKLNLGNLSDAEYIVSKAIHDGIIEATIDKDNKYIYSKETIDIYSTFDPLTQFQKRIRFCIDIHNEAIKSLQYPEKSDNGKFNKKDEQHDDFDVDDVDILSDFSDF